MNYCKMLLQSFLFILFFIIFCSIPSVSAETHPDYGKVFPHKENFRPGDWFVVAIPAQVDSVKAPIVFVQGKNNMYDRAYYAGYQTAFVQLYDAAGTGSVSPWKNGKLLAEKLEVIYQYLGKK